MLTPIQIHNAIELHLKCKGAGFCLTAFEDRIELTYIPDAKKVWTFYLSTEVHAFVDGWLACKKNTEDYRHHLLDVSTQDGLGLEKKPLHSTDFGLKNGRIVP